MRAWFHDTPQGTFIGKISGIPSVVQTSGFFARDSNREILDPNEFRDTCREYEKRHGPFQSRPSDGIMNFMCEVPVPSKSVDWTKVGSPALRSGIMTHQKRAVDTIVDIHKGKSMVSLPTGTGKTLVSCAVASHYGGKILVVAGTQRQWVEEFETWTDLVCKIVVGTSEEIVEEDVVVCTPKSVQMNDWIKNRRWTTVVVDESQILGGDCPTNETISLVSAKSKCSLMVSATPMKARPRELFNQLRGIRPDLFSIRKRFEERYCGGSVGKWGYYEANSATNTEELNCILKRLTVTCDKNIALGDLPPLRIHDVEIDVGIDFKNEFVAMNQEYQEITERLNDAPIHMKERIKLSRDVLSMKMYRHTGVAKSFPSMKWLMNLIETRDPTEKIVAFAMHVGVIEYISGTLTEKGIPHVKIDGSTPAKKRHESLKAIRDPNDPSARVAVVTLGTCATSLTLCPGATIVVLIQLSHTPTENDQAMARIWRKGATRPCDVYRLIAPGTNDDALIRINASKQKTNDRIFKRPKISL